VFITLDIYTESVFSYVETVLD